MDTTLGAHGDKETDTDSSILSADSPKSVLHNLYTPSLLVHTVYVGLADLAVLLSSFVGHSCSRGSRESRTVKSCKAIMSS